MQHAEERGQPAGALPSGDVTFLFTDIEGSTRLWEEYPDAMREALHRHDSLLHGAITSAGGHVFKTVGDAFCAAFASASQALVAAVNAQRAILAQSWDGVGTLRVRMAVHSGNVVERGGDYFGPTLNRVARLLAIGHGGQTLVSWAAHELIGADLPDGAVLQDMGSHRLKDLQQPERTFQLVHPELPNEFPPLRSLQSHSGNLPTQSSTFIGREREMAQVRNHLAETRLLTLIGAGGSGKTRLALQVAAEVMEEYPDGVWLAELAPLADPALVPQTLATTLGLREEPGRTLIETLTNYLRPKSVLLILDNCEHMIEACARLADSLLRGCPNLRILASSREGLGIAGELIYYVPSLSVPDPRRVHKADDIRQYEAIRLFTDRAQLGQPNFALTDENAHALAQICHRLDGIPLAIELAAARVKVLSVEQISARLDDRFRLLTGGSRTALPRQQTLRALIDWSYDLLSEGERALLRRLSVFIGGWELETAEAVCSGEGVEDWEVLDLLMQLVDKSLVVFEEDHQGARYRLLNTVRQYGLDRLMEAGESETFRSAHRDWFLTFAEQTEPQLQGAEQIISLKRLDAEYDNLRAALEWSTESAPAAGLRLAGALWRFWSVRGYFAEGRDWLQKTLAKTGTSGPTTERGKALRAAGALASNQGDYTAARALVGESLETWRAVGDRQGVSGSLNTLGNIAWRQGDYDAAHQLYSESLDLGRELGDKPKVAVGLISLGNVACQQGQHDSARTLYEEALIVTREIGNKEWEAASLQNLGDVIWRQGDYDKAGGLYEESLAIRRELGDKRGLAASLGNMGNVACKRQEFETARKLYEEALGTHRETGDKQWEAITLGSLGEMARMMGDYVQAQTYLEDSLAIRRDLGDKWGIANSLGSLASVAHALGDAAGAARMYGAADALRGAINVTLPAAEQDELAAALNSLQGEMGEETFRRLWEEGREMAGLEAVSYALARRADRIGV
jgi:predicted ATPase/class 3 adenylate cyclase/Tfp pilus assembly protein PilF